MRGTVFINYRRSDDAYAAALLDSELCARLGAENVFRASRSIPPGADYEDAINAAIAESKVMLVLVGPRWAKSFRRRRRRDYVLEEIVEATTRRIPLVPVLLADVEPLRAMRLPKELAPLKRRQYLRFGYREVEQDAGYIAQELRRIADLRMSSAAASLS